MCGKNVVAGALVFSCGVWAGYEFIKYERAKHYVPFYIFNFKRIFGTMLVGGLGFLAVYEAVGCSDIANIANIADASDIGNGYVHVGK